MKIVIQIPAYNEERTIAQTLRDLPKKIDGVATIETVVIDDGSSDRTSELARAAGATEIVRLPSHRGLAAAFLAGIETSLRRGADVIVNTDADNQYRGADVQALVAPILDGTADIVVGDRDVRNSPHMGPLKRLLQRLGSWGVGLASGVRVADVTSGFRAFSREAALQINVFNPFTYTLETIIQAGTRNLELRSVRIATNPPTRPSRLYAGVVTYIRKSIVTIFRVHTLYRPLKTFFAAGAVMFAIGTILGLRFLFYYFADGSSGHVQSLILAAIFLITGFQTMLFGIVADLISVNRRLAEESLVRLRKLEGRESRRSRHQRPSRKEHHEEREAEPEPADEAEQWVWLVENDDDETQPRPGSSKRKRRRRRGGTHKLTDPHRKHHAQRADDSGSTESDQQ